MIGGLRKQIQRLQRITQLELLVTASLVIVVQEAQVLVRITAQHMATTVVLISVNQVTFVVLVIQTHLTTLVTIVHVAQQKTLVLLPVIAVLITVLAAMVQIHVLLHQNVVHQVNMQERITLVAQVLTTVLLRLIVVPIFQPVVQVVPAPAYQVQVAEKHTPLAITTWEPIAIVVIFNVYKIHVVQVHQALANQAHVVLLVTQPELLHKHNGIGNLAFFNL